MSYHTSGVGGFQTRRHCRPDGVEPDPLSRPPGSRRPRAAAGGVRRGPNSKGVSPFPCVHHTDQVGRRCRWARRMLLTYRPVSLSVTVIFAGVNRGAVPTPPPPDATKARHALSLQRSFADCRVMPAAAPISAHERPSRRALATAASSRTSASLRASTAAWISSSTSIGSRC